MKKKMLSVLLAAAMVISVCACGNSGETQKTPESSETQQSVEKNSETQQDATAPATEEDDSLYPLVDSPVTLKGITIGANANPNGSTERLVWDKMAEITGITIEWEAVSSEALPTYLAAGDWPDVIHGEVLDSIIYDYGVLGGKFVNYLDYLDIMPNLAQTIEDYPLVGKGSVLSNGEMYKLLRVGNAVTATEVRPYVNTAVLEEAGVEMPTTVEEFEQALKDLKAYYGEVSFIPKLNNYYCTWAPMLYAAFGTGCNPTWDVDDGGNVYFAGMSDQMKYYYEYMNSLYEQGLIHQEVATLDSSTIKELERSGKVAFLDYAASSIPADENGEWHISCVPPLTSEYDSTQEVLGTTYVFSGTSFYICGDSEYVEELCQMIDIAYASEEVVEGSGLYGESFTYGLEGEHWDINDDGKTYTFYLPEGETSFNQYALQKLKWYDIGRGDALAGLTTDTPSNDKARQEGFAENVNPYMEAEPFPVNFLTFTEDQQYIIENKWSEIDTYVKKMQVEFITGVTDIAENWDNYCETLKKMGIDEVVAVYQEAYDTLMSK